MGTKKKGAPKTARFSGLRAWIAKEPMQAATAAGVLIYASLRIAHFLFYRRFGVMPEEVGHGYASTLAQALVGTIAIYAVLMLVVGMWLANVIVSGVQMFRRDTRKAWVVVGASLGAGAFVVVASFITASVRLTPDGYALMFISTSAVVFVYGSMLYGEVDKEWTWSRVTSVGRSLLPRLMLAGLLIVLLAVMPLLATLDGGAVYSGKRSQFADLLGLPWGADATRVEWLDESEAAATESVRCFMYLGRSDGIAVLWDPVERTSYRIPADRISLTSADAEPCD